MLLFPHTLDTHSSALYCNCCFSTTGYVQYSPVVMECVLLWVTAKLFLLAWAGLRGTLQGSVWWSVSVDGMQSNSLWRGNKQLFFQPFSEHSLYTVSAGVSSGLFGNLPAAVVQSSGGSRCCRQCCLCNWTLIENDKGCNVFLTTWFLLNSDLD